LIVFSGTNSVKEVASQKEAVAAAEKSLREEHEAMDEMKSKLQKGLNLF
jgi:hypothetical protein